MKKLVLNTFKLSDEEKKVCAGELMNCLHKLKQLCLRIPNFSPEIVSKLKTRGDEVGCEVNVLQPKMNNNVDRDWICNKILI